MSDTVFFLCMGGMLLFVSFTFGLYFISRKIPFYYVLPFMLSTIAGVAILSFSNLYPGRRYALLPFILIIVGIVGPLFLSIVRDYCIQVYELLKLKQATPGNRFYMQQVKENNWVCWEYTAEEWKTFVNESLGKPLNPFWGTLSIGALFSILIRVVQILFEYSRKNMLWFLSFPVLIMVFLTILYHSRLPKKMETPMMTRKVYVGDVGIWIPGINFFFFKRPKDVFLEDNSGLEIYMRIKTNNVCANLVSVDIVQKYDRSFLKITYTEPGFDTHFHPVRIFEGEFSQYILIPHTCSNDNFLSDLVEKMEIAYSKRNSLSDVAVYL